MDIVAYYTDVSKKEVLETKEIKEFNKNLNKRLDQVANLKFRKGIVRKLIHPIRTIKNNSEYRYLVRVKSEFDSYVNSDVLMYVVEEQGDLVSDLEGAARYYKPKIIKEYVRTIKLKNDN